MFVRRDVVHASLLSLALLAPVSLAATPGETRKLSGPMPIEQRGAVLAYALTSDGSRIVYEARQDHEEITELYSVPFDQSSVAVRLNDDLPVIDFTSADVSSFEIGSSDRVVYKVFHQAFYSTLFSVPVDGSAAPVQLTGSFVREYRLEGEYVLFVMDDDRLFSVPIDGSSAPVELAPSGGVEEFDSANGRVVFLDDQQALSVVPIDASAPPLQLAEADFSEGFARLSDVQLSADGLYAYYVERRNDVPTGTFGNYDLFRVPLDASHAPVRLSPANDPGSFGIAAYVHDLHDRVVYMVDNEPSDPTDGDLFAVDVDGSDHVQLDPPGVAVTEASEITADGARVVFGAFGGLYCAPVDGSQVATLLGSFPSIENWTLTSTDVVFVGRSNVGFPAQPFFGLYRVPLAGGPPPLLLNGPPQADRGVLDLGELALRSGAEEVVYQADTAVGSSFHRELHAVPLDGSEPPRSVPPEDREVFSFALTPDGETALYGLENGSPSEGSIVVDLRGVALDGGPSVVFNPLLVWSEVGDVQSFHLSSDGESVLYMADQDTDESLDLYTVPLDGSSEPYSLTAAVTDGYGLLDFVVAPGANRAAFTWDHGLYVTLYGVRTDPIEPPVELDTGSEVPPNVRPPIAPLHFTADSARVVYRKGSPGDSDLFSCAVDGSSPAVTLADAPEGEQVLPDFQSSPDGSTIVYRATQAARTWLAAVPSDASAQGMLLNAPAPTFATVARFALTPDGSQVLFVADQETSDVFELYRVPLDGSAPPEKLSAALATGGDVLELALTADGERVLYRADQIADGQEELFVVPVDGNGPPLRLTTLPSGRSVRSDFLVASSDEVVFYRADAETAGVTELYAVLTNGKGTPVKLSGSLVSGGRVASFAVAPDGTRIVFRADKRFDERFELFTRATVGPPVLLHGLPASADVLTYRLDPAGRRAFYQVNGLAGPGTGTGLFTVRLDGGEPSRVNEDAAWNPAVRSDFVPLADGDVLFTASQDRPETVELYRSVAVRVLPAEEPSRSTSVVR